MSERFFPKMKLLVARCSEQILYKVNDNKITQLELEDFTTHTILPQGPEIKAHLPSELLIMILKYVFRIRVKTRNFGLAFQISTVSKSMCDLLYNNIYMRDKSTTLEKLERLGRTFNLIEEIYSDYLSSPNYDRTDRVALHLTRNPTMYRRKNMYPWCFKSEIECAELTTLGALNDIHCFPGEFHGDTIWVHGDENDGIYDADVIHHPVLVFVLSDYTGSLIPTRKDLNIYWAKFLRLLKVCFGSSTGIYMMVMEDSERYNPFVETTDLFLQF